MQLFAQRVISWNNNMKILTDGKIKVGLPRFRLCLFFLPVFDKVPTKFRRNVIYLNKLSSYCFKFRVIGRDHCAENVRVPIPPSLD